MRLRLKASGEGYGIQHQISGDGFGEMCTWGAPVATPLDPRHRLVTTEYNPARTWNA